MGGGGHIDRASIWSGFVGSVLCLLALNLAVAGSLRAEVPTDQEMDNVSRNWLSEVVVRYGQWAGSQAPSIVGSTNMYDDQGTLLARCFHVAPKGFVLVPALKSLQPVTAYSDNTNLDPSDETGLAPIFRQGLSEHLEAFKSMFGDLRAEPSSEPPDEPVSKARESWAAVACFTRDFRVATATAVTADYGPMTTTAWAQGAPYNDLCPPGDGGNCVVGCTATAMAQLMNFWQWPAAGGHGSFSYVWDGDQSCTTPTGGGTLTADLSNPYDWASMPINCDSVACTPAQAAATAELCFEAGVTLKEDYGACGSLASPTRAVWAFPRMRYACPVQKMSRPDYSRSEWYGILNSEHALGRPVYYYIYNHVIVCDGTREPIAGWFQYHMNYGWADASTAWYSLDQLPCYWYAGGVCPPSWDYAMVSIVPQTMPDLRLVDYHLADAGIQNDGVVEPGETVGITLQVRNHGEDAVAATCTISSSDPYVAVTGSSAPLGDITWSQSVSTASPLTLVIDPACPVPHTATASIALTVGAYSTVDQVFIHVGDAPGLYEDMELPPAGWRHLSRFDMYRWDDWHEDTYRSHSGSHSWKAGGDGSRYYTDMGDGCLISRPVVLPPDAKLSFWHRFNISDGTGLAFTEPPDLAFVMARQFDGDWASIHPSAGYPRAISAIDEFSPFNEYTWGYIGTQDWSREVFDLSTYSGSLQVMFRLGSGRYGNREGWYIDDVFIGNTLDGDSSVVRPADGITITFASVTTPGTSLVAPPASVPPVHAPYAACAPSVAVPWEVTSTASYEGDFEICLEYAPTGLIGSESDLVLLAFDGSDWINITSSIDTDSNLVRGRTSSLGTVLVAEKTTCCVGRVGDANQSGDDEPTIGDVSAMIDARFITGTCDGILSCLSEADINQSGKDAPICDDISIGDISAIIDYLFITGESLGLPDCL